MTNIIIVLLSIIFSSFTTYYNYNFCKNHKSYWIVKDGIRKYIDPPNCGIKTSISFIISFIVFFIILSIINYIIFENNTDGIRIIIISGTFISFSLLILLNYLYNEIDKYFTDENIKYQIRN